MRKVGCVWLAVFFTGCADEGLSRQALLDPETCATCHPSQVREWQGSMHAYASDDPVFMAMNARGQRETEGSLGDFCVQCHAPMALREGATTDGLNLADVPRSLKGVTCYFCHNADAVEGTHNNPIVLANDAVMRGSFADAAEVAGHQTAYSPLLDRATIRSSDLCGSCHDVVTPRGVELERTYAEWRSSLFSLDDPAQFQSCARCHMPGREGLAAEVDGVGVRRIASHMMPGVDVAITAWPEREAQHAAVQRALDTTVFSILCVRRIAGGTEISIGLENLAAGHSFVSGASHDRRVWLELVATLGGQDVYRAGTVSDGTALVDTSSAAFWRMGDLAFKEDGSPAHMFWDVDHVDSSLLIAPTAVSPLDPRYVDPHVVRTFSFAGVADRIEMNIRLRPIGFDVLDDLIASGDLDASLREEMTTFSLAAARRVWTIDDGEGCIPDL